MTDRQSERPEVSPAEQPEREPENTPRGTDGPGYTPASPVKRTLAWIGLVYMVILVALTTAIFYRGSALGNLGPLLTVPGLIGAGVLALVSWRTQGRPGKGAAIAIAAVCWLFALATLPLGIAGLMSNFGG